MVDDHPDVEDLDEALGLEDDSVYEDEYVVEPTTPSNDPPAGEDVTGVDEADLMDPPVGAASDEEGEHDAADESNPVDSIDLETDVADGEGDADDPDERGDQADRGDQGEEDSEGSRDEHASAPELNGDDQDDQETPADVTQSEGEWLDEGDEGEEMRVDDETHLAAAAPEPEPAAESEPVDELPDEPESEPADELQDEPDPEELVEPELTGHAGVDEVLAGLADLADLEVHEHVAVFESAHVGLRRALDDGGQ